MTKEEYLTQKKELEKKHKHELSGLAKKYAHANNIVKVGDIVENSVCKIKVDKVRFTIESYFSKFPECVYSGFELKKNNEPRKDGSHAHIYQADLKKVKQNE